MCVGLCRFAFGEAWAALRAEYLLTYAPPSFLRLRHLLSWLMHDGVRPVESSRASHGSEYENRGNRNTSCVPCVSVRAHGRAESGLATGIWEYHVAHGTKRRDLGGE